MHMQQKQPTYMIYNKSMAYRRPRPRLTLCIATFLLVLAVAEAQVTPPYDGTPVVTPPPPPSPPSPVVDETPPPTTPAVETPPPPVSPPPPPPVVETPPSPIYSPPPTAPVVETPPPPSSPSPPPPEVETPPPPPPSYSPPPESPPVVETPPPTVSPPPPTDDSPPPPTYTPPPESPVVETPPPDQSPPLPPLVESPPPPSPFSPPSVPPVVETPPPSPTIDEGSPPPPTYSPPPPSTPDSPPVFPTPPPFTPLPPPPPSSGVSPKKRVRCKDKTYSDCYLREFTCPPSCSRSCVVDCETCSPTCDCNKPGAVCEDPRFIGADGITFYFHGKKNQDFCLVTDPNLHINAHFIGKRITNMGRDFTWVQSLGILFDDHHIYLGALTTAAWNDALDRLSLSFDGQPIELNESEGATWSSSSSSSSNNGVTITRSKATNAVVIESKGKFRIKAVVVPITEKESLVHNYGIKTEEDCFAHLDLSFKFYSLTGEVNGVLGQTYARNYVSRVKMGVAMPVVGGERKFSTSSLFSTDCAVSRFVGEDLVDENGDSGNNNGIQFGDLSCGSGVNGRGVVCKR